MCRLCDIPDPDGEITSDYSWKELGQEYGYPECCINAFIKRGNFINEAVGLENMIERAEESLHENQKGYIHGFIPCPSCAAKFPPGTENQLIKNRTYPKPYPNDD